MPAENSDVLDANLRDASAVIGVISSAVKVSFANCRSRLTLPGTIALVAFAFSAMTFLVVYDFIAAAVGSIAYLCFVALKEKRHGVARRKKISYECDKVAALKSVYGPSVHKSGKAWDQARALPRASSQAQRRTSATRCTNAWKQARELPKVSSQTQECLKAPEPELVAKPKASVPIKPVSFRSASWDAQLQELLRQIEPTPESRELVHRVERIVEQAISTILPHAKVTGLSGANPLATKAFAITVPEVDIVVSVPESVLKHSINCGRMNKTKVALRACADALVAEHGLKVRRSAFRADEPKVVVMVPSSLGLAEESFGFNLSVNARKPSQATALFEECARLEPRARDPILLVRRWARDRAILHAHQKGTLSPYVWTLLSIYFLQVGKRDEGPLLPTITTADGVLRKCMRIDPQPAQTRKSVSTLFQDFFDFYNSEFDWSRETVSIGDGVRGHARPQDSLLLVLDPFDTDAGPTEYMTEAGVSRLREELARAQMLCSSPGESTLAELLVPWVPPEAPPEVETSADAEC